LEKGVVCLKNWGFHKRIQKQNQSKGKRLIICGTTRGRHLREKERERGDAGERNTEKSKDVQNTKHSRG